MENKTLVERLARNLKRSKKDINNLLGALNVVIADKCANLDTVAIPGFGNFAGKKNNEYVGVDVETKKKTLFPPKVTVEFTVSNVLKNKINKKK